MSSQWLSLGVLLAPLWAVAAPLEIESSGRLLDAAGAPVNGDRSVGFSLYDAETGGNLLWSDTFTLSVQDGYYTARLGSGPVPLEISDFSGVTPWLAVTVGGSPVGARSPLASVPFALVAASGSSGEVTERAIVSNVCSASPCALESHSDGVTSIDRNGAGSYTIRFAAGTFQSTPACSVMVDGLGRVANLSPYGRSASSFSFYTGTAAGVATDFGFSVLCSGKRPTGAVAGATGCTASGSQAFDGTGATASFIVPDGCTRVQVYAWGAGGSGGRGIDYNAPGGGGGFVEAELEVTPLETLTVLVGKGGARGVTPGAGISTSAFGGGGASGDGYTGGGGGRSAIRRGTDELITAGGGGGGGAALNAGYGAGGAGGGAAGLPGGNYAGTTTGGGGGTLTAGGAGGVGGGSTGAAGIAFKGGDSPLPQSYPGGGGGGGWYGGGAGGHTSGSQASGGGGGSSHLGTGATGTLSAGSGTLPGGASEPLRNGAGDGGVSPSFGDDGRIVIVWAP
jgi:hypothetical protein